MSGCSKNTRYVKLPRQIANATAIKPTLLRSVILNKGFEGENNVRCRLVVMELKAKKKDALHAQELFSAMLAC